MTSPTESIPLLPRRSVPARLIAVAVLTAVVLIGWPPWWQVVGFDAILVLFLGTYPETSIEDGRWVRRFRVAFWRAGTVSYPLKDCMRIEIDLEWRPSMEYGLLMGVWNWVMLFVFDRLIPWFGGDYKLWLRTFRDERILAWQGNGSDNFRDNLEVLEEASGLPVVRA